MIVDFSSKHQEFERLKARLAHLEEELNAGRAREPWQPAGFYSEYHATTGFLLGSIAAGAALLVNIVGATIAGKHPLELIRVYLTFPLGAKALLLAEPGQPQTVGDGMILAFGCCLFIMTGMLLGIPVQLALSRMNGQSNLWRRLFLASGLAIALWLFNFYAVLSWLQPALFGGNWIVDPDHLPAWVAAGTHLVFGWAMALLYPFGKFVPRRLGERL
jgi:hypothetical protein